MWNSLLFHTKGRMHRTTFKMMNWHFTPDAFILEFKVSNLPQRRQFSHKYETFDIVYQHPHSIHLKFYHDTKNPFSAYFVNCMLVIDFSMLMLVAYDRWKWVQFQLKNKRHIQINKFVWFQLLMMMMKYQKISHTQDQNKIVVKLIKLHGMSF